MILYVISVGLSVTMGLMGFINLAHGVFAMAGGLRPLDGDGPLRHAVPGRAPHGVHRGWRSAASCSSACSTRASIPRRADPGAFTIGLIYASVAIARMVYGTLAVPIVLPTT
jgi:branched-chain amino acid transport system permease protein